MGIKEGRKGYYPAHVELGYQIKSAEYGSRHQPPRPFLRPALKENEARVLERIAASLRALLTQGTL
jgi:HK97 gp10 family phage protein